MKKFIIDCQRLVVFAFALGFVPSCGSNMKVAVSQVPSAATAVEVNSLSPYAAKNGETISVIGSGLTSGLKVVLNGQEVVLNVTSPTTASFQMPAGLSPGLYGASFKSGESVVKTLSIVSDDSAEGLPILIADASAVCSDTTYHDRTGKVETGTRNCSGTALADCTTDGQTGCQAVATAPAALLSNVNAATIASGTTVAGVAGSLANCTVDGATSCIAVTAFPAAKLANYTASNIQQGVTIAGVSGSLVGTPATCSVDGVAGCVTTADYKSAKMANFTAANIISGTTIAGVAGSGTASPANCSSNGQQSCVATGTYYAGTACATDGSNCFLPTYSVVSQQLKAINYNNIDQTKMLDSLTLSGVTGTVASRGSWALTASFPGAGYYTGVSSTPTASTILSGNTITGVAGNVVLPTAANVYTGITFGAASGSTGTLTVPTAANVRSAVGAYGVGGTGITPSLADCSAPDGATDCVTTSSFKSVDMSVAIAGNIKSGIVIGGVTGQYPSATYTLPNANATADLDAATFNAKVKSSTSFQYWNSAGTRQTGSGDADITDANIASGVSIFGTSGSYIGAVPDAWNVRAGVTVGGVAGLLKTDCRNGANLTSFDMAAYAISVPSLTSDTFTTASNHGYSIGDIVAFYGNTVGTNFNYTTLYRVLTVPASNTFTIALTASPTVQITGLALGTATFVYKTSNGTIEIWDTIDDYGGAETSIPSYTGWSSSNVCGGIEVTAGDSNVWSDVTTTGDGVTASTCATTPANCSFKDKITGHEWSKPDMASRDWSLALSYCQNLTYNGKSDWRLPTNKELMAAHNDGIASTAGSNWITLANMRSYYFWSSTVNGNGNISTSWNVSLATGSVAYKSKNTLYMATCIRP